MDQKIFQLIPKIMAEVGSIAKKRKSTQGQVYNFRGIDDFYDACQEPFAKHGVFCAPTVLESSREERQSRAGGNLIYTVMRVKFTFYADDGSYFEATTAGEAMDSGDKSANKAMSAAMKYVLTQVFCVPTNEDNDTENHSHEVFPKSNQAPVNGPRIAPDSRPAPQPSPGPSVGSGAHCEACGAELVISKSGAGYYCPNFKDSSKGEHTRIKAVELPSFKAAQEMKKQNDIPF